MNIQEDLDINDTVRVSSRCFEVSPYLERYDSPDTDHGCAPPFSDDTGCGREDTGPFRRSAGDVAA